MKETNKIIVPVDLSEATESLVTYAVYIAEKLSATIHFVHVINFIQFTSLYSGGAMKGIPHIEDCEEYLITNAKGKLSNLIRANSEKCSGCTGEVVTGDPAEKIVEIAGEQDANLIITSTHGFKGLESLSVWR